MANRDRVRKTDPLKNPARPAISLSDLTNAMMSDEPLTEKVIADTPQDSTASDNALVILDDQTFMLGRVTLTKTEMALPDDLSEEEWYAIGDALLNVKSAISWWLGDWMKRGEDRKWGESYKALADRFEYEIETLWVYASIARNVKTLIRNQGLSFTHHRLVASMESDEEKKHWLDQAAENKWTVKQMREAIRDKDRPTPPTKIEDFEQKYASFAQKVHKMASGAGEGERTQMVALLRKLADDIENS